MATYIANLVIVLAAAGKMLAFLAPALAGGAAIAWLISRAKNNSPRRATTEGHERGNL